MNDPTLQFEAGDVPTAAITAAPPHALDAHRSHRVRRLKLAVLTSVVIRPLSVIVPLVAVPLFLRYLGAERYGLYETIGAMAMWLALSDAGLGMGLQNRLQACVVRGDEEAARRYVSSLLVALAALTVVLIALLSAVVPMVDWQRVFPAADPRARAEVPWAIWVAGVVTLLGTVSNVSVAVYNAYQEQHRATLWDGAARLITLAASVAVVHTHLGLVGVLLAAYGFAALVRLLNAIQLLGFDKPHLRPSPALFDLHLVRVTLADGIYMFVLQFAVVLIFQSDRVVIGALLSPADVTPYAIAGRLFLIAYGLFMIVLAPLWPAYGEAIRRGDLAFVRRGVRLTILLGCGSVAACGVILLFAGPRVFAFWTRTETVHISRSLILAMTATFVCRAWVDSRTIALNSVGIFRPQIVFFGAHAILNLALATLLARPFGVEGVAWATPVTALVTSCWGYPWLMRRLYARDPRDRSFHGHE